MSTSTDVTQRMALLRSWLAHRLDTKPLAWVDEQCARIAASPAGGTLPLAIGLVSRRTGKQPLILSDDERAAAEAARPGLDTSGWSIDQVARILFMLASFAGAEDSFAGRLDARVRSSEIGEQIALYRGLPLYPQAASIVATAAEGIRSAVQPIYEAVAHCSPYPSEQFSEAMWNQMVVKALFIGSTLAPIQKLDERRNADLARMLVDYAHERWAAGRTVSPELWRCVGPFGESYMDDLLRVFESASATERRAAALALSECPDPDALAVLESDPSLWRDIRSGSLGWHTLKHA